SLPHRLDPGAVVELPLDLAVGAALADTVVADAGEVGLAADPGAETDVQRVVPDVQLPGCGRVRGGDEVHGALVRDVHDVLVRADAVVAGHLVVRKLGGGHAEPPTRVREPGDSALRLAPLQHGEVPRRP